MSCVDIPSLNALFVHVPKTAGVSFSRALADAAPDAKKLPVRDMDTPLGAAQYITSRLHPGVVGRRWSVCVVRNPWDWAVSGYRYVTISRDAYAGNAPSFTEFLKGQWTTNLARNPQHLKFTSPRTFVAYHCKLTLADHIAADPSGTPAPFAFYARFERLARDWEVICERLGVDLPLEHENRGDRTHYTEYYDDQTRAIVAARHKPFIERFGYKFGD